jgi:hypothetical protein
LHPKVADPVALGAVVQFLGALGHEPHTEPDADTPMLVKNLSDSLSTRG